MLARVIPARSRPGQRRKHQLLRRWSRLAAHGCLCIISGMNAARRLHRYVSAWTSLRELRRLTADTHSIDEIVDQVFSRAYGFFQPYQIREEMVEALKLVATLRPRWIVEIGTAGGGSLLLWSRVAHPEATIVSLDLPGAEFGGRSSLFRVPLIRRMALSRQTLYLIRADSHAPETLALTRRYLAGHPADFLFIDADHTPAGVRKDYAMYSALVREGGIIGFHDIADERPNYGVKTLWDEISRTHTSHEFRAGTQPGYGIGMLFAKAQEPDQERNAQP
jgi:predicted O-methyltransferase YrrM